MRSPASTNPAKSEGTGGHLLMCKRNIVCRRKLALASALGWKRKERCRPKCCRLQGGLHFALGSQVVQRHCRNIARRSQTTYRSKKGRELSAEGTVKIEAKLASFMSHLPFGACGQCWFWDQPSEAMRQGDLQAGPRKPADGRKSLSAVRKAKKLLGAGQVRWYVVAGVSLRVLSSGGVRIRKVRNALPWAMAWLRSNCGRQRRVQVTWNGTEISGHRVRVAREPT